MLTLEQPKRLNITELSDPFKKLEEYNILKESRRKEK